MAGVGTWKKKVMEDKDRKDSAESSKRNVESNRSGKGWLERFRMMKVGLPRHIRAMMGSANHTRKNLRRKKKQSAKGGQ